MTCPRDPCASERWPTTRAPPLRARLAVTLAVTLAVLSGCDTGTTIDEYPCPDSGTALTYENFGQPFLGPYCQRCHGATLGSRHGAPTDYDFGTLEQVQRWRERIFARAAADNDSMPPGPDDPPIQERVRLAEWLACGAP